jgi:hypothetical protein
MNTIRENEHSTSMDIMTLENQVFSVRGYRAAHGYDNQ